MLIPYIENLEEKKLIALMRPIFGTDPACAWWPVQAVYDKFLEKVGPCLAIGVGQGVPFFVNYLRSRPHFCLSLHPYGMLVRTNITNEYFMKILKDLEAQEYLDNLANKVVGNTPENSIIAYCPVSETEWKFVLLFKNQDHHDIPKTDAFTIIPNIGFHLRSFIAEFNLGRVLRCIIRYLLQHHNFGELGELHNHVVSSDDICDATRRWLIDYRIKRIKLVSTIVTLFPQVFVVFANNVIVLKISPEENPSDGRLCLEILRVQKMTSKLPQILMKLPDFCRSRIQNQSDLEHFFQRFPDLLTLPSNPTNQEAGPWNDIKNELSSLTGASAFIDEESIGDLEQFSTRIRDLADKVQALHLSTRNEQMDFNDLKPIEQSVDEDSVIDIS